MVPEDDITVMVVIMLLKPVPSLRNESDMRIALSINDGLTEIFAIV